MPITANTAPTFDAATDPRTPATGEAFQTLVNFLEGRREGLDGPITDAILTARYLMVPEAGPRPTDFTHQQTSLLPQSYQRGGQWVGPASPWDPESTELLTDILTTAVEGGIGYWSACEEYVHDGPVRERRAVIRETESNGDESESVVRHRVDLWTIQEGLKRIRSEVRRADGEPGLPPAYYVAADLLRYVGSLTESGQETFQEAMAQLDAEVADVVVQVALFGQIVYGRP